MPRAAGLGGLLLVGLLCAALLSGTHHLTAERIGDNTTRAANAEVYALLGINQAAASAPAPDWRDGVWALCDGRFVVRRAASGYAGPISMIVGIDIGNDVAIDISNDAAIDTGRAAPRLIGVRVAAHAETPGIADFLDRPTSGWLAALSDLPAAALDRVDTVSGATISSRAVLRDLGGLLDEVPALMRECGP